MKLKIFDSVMRTLTNVKYVPKLRMNLISLGNLDTSKLCFFSFFFFLFAKDDIVNKCVLIAMSENFIHLDWEDNFRYL